MLSTDRDELGEANLGYKAHDPVVARMHLQQQTRPFGDRALVIRGARAIGGPHLFENGPAPGHDLGNPESAANFNQFAARDDHLFALGECVQRKQYCGGVVVDHRRRLSPGELDEELFNHLLALSALTPAQVVFKVDGVRSGTKHGLHGCRREQRPSEVGVQDRARCVHDPLERDTLRLADARLQRGEDRFGFERARVDLLSLGQRGSELVENVAASLHDVLAIESDEQTAPFSDVRAVG